MNIFKNINNITLSYHKIGFSKFNINKNVGNIYNIYVNKEYRNLNYGSYLLDQSEKMLVDKYNVNLINLVAWQKQNDQLINFYLKNGYLINGPITFYDDEDYIYDIIPMIKKLN